MSLENKQTGMPRNYGLCNAFLLPKGLSPLLLENSGQADRRYKRVLYGGFLLPERQSPISWEGTKQFVVTSVSCAFIF